MTELELYKFITENDIEYHWYKDNELFAYINIINIPEFNKLLGENIVDESGIDCVMKHNYFCFEMSYICDYFGIDINNIFTKEY